VLLVRSGEIEILREVGATSVVLGHVRDGEWLGEMGVIEGRNRSAAARERRHAQFHEATCPESTYCGRIRRAVWTPQLGGRRVLAEQSERAGKRTHKGCRGRRCSFVLVAAAALEDPALQSPEEDRNARLPDSG